MANYVPFVRSNYFEVKDPAAFKAFCEKWGVDPIGGGDRDGLAGFMGAGEIGIPLCYYDPEKGEHIEGEFMKELGGHLADGWVAIVREIGYEKMRDLGGYTGAVKDPGGGSEGSAAQRSR